MKNENKTQFYIIYDNREEEKATPTKEQFLESLLFTITCGDLKEPISKEDIYFYIMGANEENHDGTIQEWFFEFKDNSKMIYRKVNC